MMQPKFRLDCIVVLCDNRYALLREAIVRLSRTADGCSATDMPDQFSGIASFFKQTGLGVVDFIVPIADLPIVGFGVDMLGGRIG